MELGPYEAASEEAISFAAKALGLEFPLDFRQFVQQFNGFEGVDNSYVALWPIADLAELNEAYAVSRFAPGLVLFGSDGGDTAYGFDTRDKSLPVVAVPFIGVSMSSVRHLASTFDEFLELLFRS